MSGSPIARKSLLALAAIAMVLLAACASQQNTFEPRSDAADRILTLYIIVLVAASLVGAAVLFGLAFILIKYRARPGRKAQQLHGSNKLEVGWTIGPIVILVAIAIPTMFAIAGAAEDPVPDALHITATGHQWWFEFEYPGLGPNGESLFTANELRVPVGRQVAITLESDDVIHSFWVPQLVGKTDMIPNRTNYLEPFVPNEIGEFYGQCAEFCGSAHALMQFRVHVDSTADFDHWVDSMNSAPSEPAAGSAEARGQQVFQTTGCSVCHTIQGTIAAGRIGPDLTLLGDRGTIGAGILDNTDSNLRAWIKDNRSIKPIPTESVPGGTVYMPAFAGVLSDGQIADVAAYLRSLQLR